jgi:hypothetical protein
MRQNFPEAFPFYVRYIAVAKRDYQTFLWDSFANGFVKLI